LAGIALHNWILFFIALSTEPHCPGDDLQGLNGLVFYFTLFTFLALGSLLALAGGLLGAWLRTRLAPFI
jgi:hypothetical protein